VSLNNRISIRNTYGARKAVDCQFTASHGCTRSEATTDTTLLEAEKHGKCPTNPRMSLKRSSVSTSVAVTSFLPFFADAELFLRCRHTLILITANLICVFDVVVPTDGHISGFQTDRCLNTALTDTVPFSVELTYIIPSSVVLYAFRISLCGDQS
jgi:hypothetical protein